MIDTHAHIFVEDFKADFEAMMSRAELAGITDIVMPSIKMNSLFAMEALSGTKIRLHKTIGIHPCDVEKDVDSSFLRSSLLEVALREDIVAIGETGLDYYWNTELVEDQKRSLKIHIEVAKELGKPIILHNRNSTADLLEEIEIAQDGRLQGVWHCFTGTLEEGKKALDLGLRLGIGGVITFKNGQIDTFVEQLGLENLILETDSPYLAPAPHRGKRNEPAYTSLVCAKLASIFGIEMETIDRTTSETARTLFKL